VSASVFIVEEKAKKESSVKQIISRACFLPAYSSTLKMEAAYAPEYVG
jgi:hypothetical protein